MVSLSFRYIIWKLILLFSGTNSNQTTLRPITILNPVDILVHYERSLDPITSASDEQRMKVVLQPVELFVSYNVRNLFI